MTGPSRLTGRDGALLVVDLQDRLLAAIEGRDRVVAAALRLARGARILGLPTLATEQNPGRLGPSTPDLAALVADRPGKMTFHCLGAPGIAGPLEAGGVRHVTLAGIEAHVCVAQTALELIDRGYRVQVAVDAVGSRFAEDRAVALGRLDRAGATLTTAEAVLFEWVESADHPSFRAISALVKERTGS